jgi:hypothetical protein
MLSKKKHHFLQLAVVFSSITVLALLSAWGFQTYEEKSSGMMGQSMGNMMSSMHAGNANLSDLLVQQESVESMNNSQSGMESHHEVSSAMKTAHYFTTAIIVILLPFILAGTVFLAVVWLK